MPGFWRFTYDFVTRDQKCEPENQHHWRKQMESEKTLPTQQETPTVKKTLDGESPLIDKTKSSVLECAVPAAVSHPEAIEVPKAPTRITGRNGELLQVMPASKEQRPPRPNLPSVKIPSLFITPASPVLSPTTPSTPFSNSNLLSDEPANGYLNSPIAGHRINRSPSNAVGTVKYLCHANTGEVAVTILAQDSHTLERTISMLAQRSEKGNQPALTDSNHCLPMNGTRAFNTISRSHLQGSEQSSSVITHYLATYPTIAPLSFLLFPMTVSILSHYINSFWELGSVGSIARVMIWGLLRTKRGT